MNASNRVLGFFLAFSLSQILFSCGKPSELEQLKEEGMIPVSGVAGFGGHCPYGSVTPPSGAKLQLWNCPIGLNRLELSQPLDALYLQADCKKKILTVRMGERRLDTAWAVMPDGSFFITVDGGLARLNADGPDRGSCSTPLTADISGRLDCGDRDKAKISIETTWWMGKAENPATLALANPQCQLPSSCYLYAATTVSQCGD